MKNQTAGHLAISGGVRGHSAGGIFPYIIAIKGNNYHLIGNGKTFGQVWAERCPLGFSTLTAYAHRLLNGEHS